MALSQSKFSFKVCHFGSVGLGARFFRGEADIFSDWRFNKPVIPFLLFVLAGVSQSTSEGFRLKAVLQTLRVKMPASERKATTRKQLLFDEKSPL